MSSDQNGLQLQQARWAAEQAALKSRLVVRDDEGFSVDSVQLVGGVDISFVKDSATAACASLVVVRRPSLEVVYEETQPVTLDQPYIPGFLAFREVRFLVDLIERLRARSPEMMPQVILVDGNGVLHPNGLGLASHLGVLVDVPTVGVAKTMFAIDGLHEHGVKARARTELLRGGDRLELKGEVSGTVYGVALRTLDSAPNPVYVSIGHRISLESAIALVLSCCLYREPEPIRQADLRSRQFLRET